MILSMKRLRKMNKNQAYAKKYLDRLEQQRERELIRAYQVALKELRSKIATIYEKYDGNWVEMQKYNRLDKLEKEIGREISKLTGKTAQTLNKSQRDVYTEAYYLTGYILSNEVNADLGYVALNTDTVKKAIENPLDRVGFLQRNRDNQHLLTRQLREQLAQGFIQGESYRSVAKRVKERMDVGASKALTIARTENHRVRTQAQLDSIAEGEKAGITLKKQWVATIDGNTRDRHGDLDGIQVDPSDEFKIDGYAGEGPGLFGDPEMDINCRCTLIEIVAGFKPNTRRVRGVGITEYKTFNEYKKQGLQRAS